MVFMFHKCRGQDFEKAGELRDKEMELKAKISAITGAAKEEEDAEAETTGAGPMVTDQDIANIVSQWTGIPIEKVRSAEGQSGSCRVHLPLVDTLCMLTRDGLPFSVSVVAHCRTSGSPMH